MPAGRPLKWSSVEELQVLIDQYFQDIKDNVTYDRDGQPVYEPLTITGLALAIGTTRQGIADYMQRPEYTDAIRIAKTRIENYAEKKLFGTSATGPIFALKNYGWKDTQDVNQNNIGSPQVVITKNYLKPQESKS